jgi:hypothetical protein
MGGTLPAFAGTSFANEDNHTNKCRKQVDYFHETIAARKFPVSADEFPVPRKQIPCSEKNRESPQTVQIAVRFLVALHQNGTKQAEFRKIPCYFPCSQGIRPLRIG